MSAKRTPKPEATRAHSRNPKGFTLVELAVVLVIVGIIMTLGLKMGIATLENAAFSETKAKQERIKLALIAYLRTNGKLPCPDTQDSPTGDENPLPCNTGPEAGYGVIPWQKLGLPREAALDGWGNFFSYRVANSKPAGKDWTQKTSASTDFSINELKAPTAALTVQEKDAAGVNIALANTAPVAVLISHGPNGFGAKTTKVVSRLPVTDATVNEILNATVGSSSFVIQPSGASFDDILAYMTPSDLLTPLVSEGSLKACVAYCLPSAAGCTCTASGVPYCLGSTPVCSTGTLSCAGPQCLVPTTGCAPVAGSLPIGATPTLCL